RPGSDTRVSRDAESAGRSAGRTRAPPRRLRVAANRVRFLLFGGEALAIPPALTVTTGPGGGDTHAGDSSDGGVRGGAGRAARRAGRAGPVNPPGADSAPNSRSRLDRRPI